VAHHCGFTVIERYFGPKKKLLHEDGSMKTCGFIFPGGSADRSYRHDHSCSLLSNGSREHSIPGVHQFRRFCFILELQPPQSWQIHIPVSTLQPEKKPSCLLRLNSVHQLILGSDEKRTECNLHITKS
jgi:hypothetical protein